MNRLRYSRPTMSRRSLGEGGDPILLTPRESLALLKIGLEPDDSQTLSEIARTEKRRARILAISIIVLLIVAVCLQLLQS